MGKMSFNKIINIKFFLIFILVVLIPVWIFILTPIILKIPNNFSYTAHVVSVDNFYDEKKQEFKGEQYSKKIFSYETVSHEGNNLVIKNTFDVKSLDGKQVFKTEPLYGIDAKTGEHITELGDRNREGYLFAPRGLKKGQGFTYWHVSSNIPIEMEYVDQEYLNGVKVFKYKKAITQEVDQTEFMGFLPEVPEIRGIKLVSELYLWIEPVSGYLVNLEDLSTDYYYYDITTGKKIVPYNKFINTFSETSIIEHSNIAKTKKMIVVIIKYITPLLILLLLVGISMITRFKKMNRVIAIEHKIGIPALVVMLTLTGLAYFMVHNSVQENSQLLFENETNEIRDLIVNRLDTYFNILYGGKGLFSTSKSVERDDWYNFIGSLDIEKKHPGIQGVGFSQVVSPSEKDNFIKTIQNEGFPNFTITPEGPRETYTSIIYLEPFNERNQKAFGYDMFSNETRRDAMSYARDTGNLGVSGKVTLLQENTSDVQAGFLAYIPVYKNGAILESVSDRQSSILGYVYSPFRMGNLMYGVLGSKKIDLDIHIYDGLVKNEESLLLDFLDDDANQETMKPVLFKKTETIYIGNHPWTIEYVKNTEQQKKLQDTIIQMIISIGGSIFSFLIYVLIYKTLRSKKEIINYADKVTIDLIESKEDLVKKNKDIEEKLIELDRTNKVMVGRELVMIELKKEIDVLKNKKI